MSIDYSQLPPPPEGDLPAFWKGTNAGDSVSGIVQDVRIVGHPEYGDAPCIDINTGVDPATGNPVIVPVLASTNSLYRQVYNLQPAVGGQIRVTFQGYSGRAKIYTVDYQAPSGQVAPPQVPQAQGPTTPQPAPTGFAPPHGQGDPTPWAAPAEAAPTGPPAWGA